MTELYKLDSEKRLRILRIWTEGNQIIQESGLIDGKLARSESTCVGKNTGKTNGTTADEQAVSEMESKITKKLKKEYFRTIEEAQTATVILPMLAKKFKEEKRKVKYPCYVQPKLDGMRCLGKDDYMNSRDNGEIETMDHIMSELEGIQEYLDGELYCHGLSFQENMKLVKKKRPESVNVRFRVYDMISDEPFIDRYLALTEIVKNLKYVELVPTFIINNEEDLKKFHIQFLAEGYEGTMVRWGNNGYEMNKRSSCLLKYKDFLDEALPVIDVIPFEKWPDQGKVVCIQPDGQTFECGMKFSHAERREILKNKEEYIGLTAEVRFFEYTDKGVPRFPVCHGFRLDK